MDFDDDIDGLLDMEADLHEEGGGNVIFLCLLLSVLPQMCLHLCMQPWQFLL